MDLDIVLDNDKRFIARCAAIIYNKDKTKVLMFNFKDYYMLPGGRIEFNETSLDAIKREIKEETGYDLKFTFKGVQENFLRKDNKDSKWAKDIVKAYLNAEFQGGRHEKRIAMIHEIESR